MFIRQVASSIFMVTAFLTAVQSHAARSSPSTRPSTAEDCNNALAAPGTGSSYVEIPTGKVPLKAWIRGVEMEDVARRQLEDIARLPFIFSHLAVMPDVHVGKGATVGSVIPTRGAIIPAAVGVDIGCGMMATETTLTRSDLPADLSQLRLAIEDAVPVGGVGAEGGWRGLVPATVSTQFRTSKLDVRLDAILRKHPQIPRTHALQHLATLGGGNHFIELTIDEGGHVWVMLHTGSRGIGNAIGMHFISLAKKMLSHRRDARFAANRDLAWFEQGEAEFKDYLEAVHWAQDYARLNREIIMQRVLMVLRREVGKFKLTQTSVNSHHNYVNLERHFGEEIYVTRKGATSAKLGELGIIPGSMGARSYIVEGKGNAQSFTSSSHGAGRSVSRSDAKILFTLEEHCAATEGVECRKDIDIIDETPAAYKDIDAVMAAQSDLVNIRHTLKQILSVKGI